MKQTLCYGLLAAAVLATSACASKPNRVYIGQCALPGHWFCGKVYDSRAACNLARRKHDYETSMPGTCFSGAADGSPDNRTM